jgi:hypothetical protein
VNEAPVVLLPMLFHPPFSKLILLFVFIVNHGFVINFSQKIEELFFSEKNNNKGLLIVSFFIFCSQPLFNLPTHQNLFSLYLIDNSVKSTYLAKHKIQFTSSISQFSGWCILQCIRYPHTHLSAPLYYAYHIF